MLWHVFMSVQSSCGRCTFLASQWVITILHSCCALAVKNGRRKNRLIHFRILLVSQIFTFSFNLKIWFCYIQLLDCLQNVANGSKRQWLKTRDREMKNKIDDFYRNHSSISRLGHMTSSLFGTQSLTELLSFPKFSYFLRSTSSYHWFFDWFFDIGHPCWVC
jgi:hypothetical protein